jgi:hypothetical protein
VIKEESVALLIDRWSALEGVVRHYGGDPATDLARDDLAVYLKIVSAKRSTQDGLHVRDPYWFRLEFDDYDDHGARIYVCNPDDRSKVGIGKQFYPVIDGNGVFNHEAFLCMPGERRCYEGHHAEWKHKEHFHPEVVAGYLFELLRSPSYKGRLNPS